MYFRTLCIQILALCSISHAQLPAEQLFDWDVGTDDGRCSSAQMELIDIMVQDAYELNNAALWAIAQEHTALDDVIMPFFTAYLGVIFDRTWEPWTDEDNTMLDTAIDTFGRVADFLETGILSYSTLKPFLMCDDTSLEQVSWYTAAMNSAGEKVYKSNNPADGYYTYKDLFPDDVDGSIPFWSQVQRAMVVDDGPNRPCYGTSGMVIKSLDVTTGVGLATNPWAASLILCPAFMQRTNPPTVDSLNDMTYPTPDNPIWLNSQMPRGATLLHELTHLVNPRVIDHWYPLQDVLANGWTGNPDSVNNAESYMFFAMAAWYYLYPPEGQTAATFYNGKSDDSL